MAKAYSYLYRLNEAEELQVQVLEKYKKFLGPEHPETLLIMSDLAVTYSRFNRVDKAE